jgi:hypothetical protein
MNPWPKMPPAHAACPIDQEREVGTTSVKGSAGTGRGCVSPSARTSTIVPTYHVHMNAQIANDIVIPLTAASTPTSQCMVASSRLVFPLRRILGTLIARQH